MRCDLVKAFVAAKLSKSDPVLDQLQYKSSAVRPNCRSWLAYVRCSLARFPFWWSWMVLNNDHLLLILCFCISVSVLHRYSPKKSHSDALKHNKVVCLQCNKKRWWGGEIFSNVDFFGAIFNSPSENTDCSKDCSAEENKYCAKEKGTPTCKCMPNFEKKNDKCVPWVLSFFLCSCVLGKDREEEHLAWGHPLSRRTGCS